MFREYNLQRLQSKDDESAEEEEMKQQKRMKITKDLTWKIRSKGWMDAKNRWWVPELLAADCVKAWDPSRMGRHHAGGDEKEGREGKDGGNASLQSGAND